jgi:hypothetical protein
LRREPEREESKQRREDREWLQGETRSSNTDVAVTTKRFHGR